MLTKNKNETKKYDVSHFKIFPSRQKGKEQPVAYGIPNDIKNKNFGIKSYY